MSTESSVKVCFRFRNNVKGGPDAVTFQDAYQVSVLSEEMKARGERKRQYRFDRTWQGDSTQEEVYRTMGKPLLKNIFDGYNSTLFVYGQTGSGKTYSMFGPDGGDMRTEAAGMVPRLMQDLFRKIESDRKENPELTYTVSLAIVDIYLERVRDLQNPAVTKKDSPAQNLQVRYHKKCGVNIHYAGDRRRGATEVEVNTVEDVMAVMERARALQVKTGAVAATKMNDKSSRSHLVVSCTIKESGPDGEKKTKLLMIDLAGSEKVRNTGAVGTQLQQAQNINYGLSILGRVLHSLTDPKEMRRREAGKGGAIPFRDSNLTRILQDSLGGNSKTALICTARPEALFAQETLSTLRFGNNAKKIKNKAIKQIARTAAQWEKLHQADQKRMQGLMADIQRQQRMRQVYERRSSIFEEELVAAGVDMASVKAKHEELQVDVTQLEREISSHDGSLSLSAIDEDGEEFGLLGDAPLAPPRCGRAPGGLPAGKCRCGLAEQLARERMVMQDREDELHQCRTRMLAQECEMAQLQDTVCGYEEAEAERQSALREANALKGDLFQKASEIERLQAQNEHLREQAQYARTELQTHSNTALTRNIEAFRDNMRHLGKVALDDATEVLKVMHGRDREAKNLLTQRISNQTAELHRLQALVDAATTQIDAFKQLKEHHARRSRDMGQAMLNLSAVHKRDAAAFAIERRQLVGQVARRDGYIAELKQVEQGSDYKRSFGQAGLEAYMAALPSKNRNLRRKKRRARRGAGSPSGLAIKTRQLEAGAAQMTSPCA